MKTEWLIVDGFSLLYREPECEALLRAGKSEMARRLLLVRLARVACRLARNVTVVFDGRGAGGVSPAESEAGIEVMYSPSGLTADTVIERLVTRDSNPARILVVTSDRLEREAVSAAGADSMGCSDFLHLCAGEATLPKARKRRPPSGPRLGDFFPGPG